MPEWIHNRAEHLLAKNPSMPKSMAFGLATQQSHATGHSPKGYGTTEGRREAKVKYTTPKDDEQKANPGKLTSPKLAAASVQLPVLPPFHKAGTVVTKGGSHCGNCKYAEVREDGPHCTSPEYQAWAGTSELVDADVDESGAITKIKGRVLDATTYCSDWWEAKAQKTASLDSDIAELLNRPSALDKLKAKVTKESDEISKKSRGAYIGGKIMSALPTRLRDTMPTTLKDKFGSVADEGFARMQAKLAGGLMNALKNPSIREHGTELAGLGILAVPGLDTMQSQIRARLAGDKSHEGAEKRRFMGELGHAATDVGGLGVLMAPEIGKLLKHSFATGFPDSQYAGNKAQNAPGMKSHSLLPAFEAPPLAIKESGLPTAERLSEILEVKEAARVGVLKRVGELITGSRAKNLTGAADDYFKRAVERAGVSAEGTAIAKGLHDLGAHKHPKGEPMFQFARNKAKAFSDSSKRHLKASQKLNRLGDKESDKVDLTRFGVGTAALTGTAHALGRRKNKEKEAGIGVGSSMTTSQYSGPLSYGPFKMTSGIPPFRSPGMTKADATGVPEEWMVGDNKTAASMNTATGAMNPEGRLNVTQRVGAPKTTGVSGPSIADISKPKGFGNPISGAQKNQL